MADDSIDKGKTIDKTIGDKPPIENGLSPDVMFGQYRIIRLLGRGGMGEVYEVEHQVLHRRYALKLIPQELVSQKGFLERFKREAQVMANLDHTNIVKVDDFGDTNGRYWLRMELVEGIDKAGKKVTTLDELAEINSGKLEQGLLAGILNQILEGLSYAHGKGAVHRDLKPANILLSGRDISSLRVEISDFGLVRLVGEEWVRSRAEQSVSLSLSLGKEATEPDKNKTGTSTRSLLGTYEYMSPEQKRGEEVDAKTDLYSVGLITFRLLTGRREISFDLPSEIDRDFVKGWDVIVKKALQSDKDNRFTSAEEILKVLSEVIAGIEKLKILQEKVKPGESQRLGIKKKDTWKKTAIVLASLVILIGSGYAGYTRYKQYKKNKVEVAHIQKEEVKRKAEAERLKGEERKRQEEIENKLKELRVTFLKGDYDGCIKMAREVLQIVPDNEEAAGYITKSQEKIKETETARQREEREKDYQRWYDKGIEAMMEGKDGPAIIAIEQALEYIEKEEARNKLNELYHTKYTKEGKVSEDKGDLQTALELYNKAKGYKDNEEIKKKISGVEKGIRLEEEYKMYYTEGEKSEAKKEWEKAIQFYEEAVKTREKKEAREKIENCKKELEKETALVKYQEYFNEGKKYEETKEYQKAIESYRGALKYLPDDKDALERINYCNTVSSPKEFTNSIDMKFVLIKAGAFQRGSLSKEHSVTLPKDFYLQTTEVTQAQYEEVMGKNPSYWKGRDLPLESVTWEEAIEFCKKLSEKEGKKYRLPTEAEWEYACKAGNTDTKFDTGISLERQKEEALIAKKEADRKAAEEEAKAAKEAFIAARKTAEYERLMKEKEKRAKEEERKHEIEKERLMKEKEKRARETELVARKKYEISEKILAKVLKMKERSGYAVLNYGDKTRTVGQNKSNSWGLYDMMGNVWEWCSDWYDDKYSTGSVTNPTGPDNGEYKVLRGGSWWDEDLSMYGIRYKFPLGCKSSRVGFRCVMNP